MLCVETKERKRKNMKQKFSIIKYQNIFNGKQKQHINTRAREKKHHHLPHHTIFFIALHAKL